VEEGRCVVGECKAIVGGDFFSTAFFFPLSLFLLGYIGYILTRTSSVSCISVTATEQQALCSGASSGVVCTEITDWQSNIAIYCAVR